MPTITDVAERAGVSVATVSRALRGLPNVSPATRDRVRRAADELAYVVDPSASRLAAGRTSTVGLVLPRLGQWYYSQLLARVDVILREAALDVLPMPLSSVEVQQRFLHELPFRKRVDALIVVDIPMTESQLDRLSETNVAVVTVGVASDRFSSFTIDNAHGTRQATDHLVGLGHRRIGIMGGGVAAFEFTNMADRLRGYEESLQHRGIVVDPFLHVPAAVNLRGGAQSMQDLLQRADRPTAVVAMSDEMAIGAIQSARQFGARVPEDLSVVGFDDHEVSEFIGLTTVRQDVAAQGEWAARWVLDRLAHRSHLVHEVQRPELIVRSTTARPG